MLRSTRPTRHLSRADVHPRAVAKRHPDADERLRAFAQNKWQRGNLTLNLGVRYDLENTPIRPTLGYNPFFSNPDDYVIDKNNIAPRLGFTWKPGGSTTSVLRGGYGKFYDKVILITTAPFLNQSIYSTSFLAAFPTSTADAGPAAGRLPTDPMLLKRSGRTDRR